LRRGKLTVGGLIQASGFKSQALTNGTPHFLTVVFPRDFVEIPA
jgi:hypothetical protein